MLRVICCFILILTTLPVYAANVVVVLDDSGSMEAGLKNTTRIEAAKGALESVVKGLPEDTNLGILLLNGETWSDGDWLVPLGKLEKQDAIAKVRKIQTNGGTPLGACLKMGADALLDLRASSRQTTQVYKLLIITDGEARDSHLVESYLPDIKSRGIRIETVGVDLSPGHSLSTPGKVNSYRNVTDPASLTKEISETFAEVTPTQKAGEESDFDLIAPLSEELASSILVAFTESTSSNHPIGEEPPEPVVQETGKDSDSASIGDEPEAEDGGSVGLAMVLGVLIGVVVAAFLFIKFIASNARYNK